ncbi:MAG: YidH family protein [Candidatus Binataceae bacterium]
MADQTMQGTLAIDSTTDLARERTRAAYERTMMSWIRTATSLITFGFSIYKFFQIEAAGRPHRNYLIGPRQFALMLVVIGLAALMLGTLEYRQNIRALGPQYLRKRRSLAVLIAAFLSLVGILGLLAMIFRQ